MAIWPPEVRPCVLPPRPIPLDLIFCRLIVCIVTNNLLGSSLGIKEVGKLCCLSSVDGGRLLGISIRSRPRRLIRKISAARVLFGAGSTAPLAGVFLKGRKFMHYNKKLSAGLSTAVAFALGAGVMAGNAVGSSFARIPISQWSFGSNIPQHVTIKDEPLSLTVTPTQNIDHAYAILGSIGSGGTESVNVTTAYLNGELSYLGNLTAGTQYTITGAEADVTQHPYESIIGLAPAQSGSTSQNVILGLGTSSANNVINNNIGLSSYYDFLSALIPSSFNHSISGTGVLSVSDTISGVSISQAHPESSLDELLNGSYPAEEEISEGGVGGVYTGVGAISPDAVGESYQFSVSIPSKWSSELEDNAMGVNSSGVLVNFDSPTSAGTIDAVVPEPGALMIFATAIAGGLLLARRRQAPSR